MNAERRSQASKGGRHLVSGGLLRIFKLGVLIVGDSGVGKSESALELIARGHGFVTDDAVEVRRASGGRLIGSPPELGRHYMEVRGLGIINIKEIFGARAICERSPIDLVIALRRMGKYGRDGDRLGLKAPAHRRVMGAPLPQIVLPVAPGRNIATLIEVACKVHLLRQRGYNASREIVKHLHRVLAEKTPKVRRTRGQG
ncbi:MAG: hypothetical protein JW747_08010 [Candidatus Aminicenantes bacterium]|nr:hypothetical protein [Candidatus Aminicenantes bacterium]